MTNMYSLFNPQYHREQLMNAYNQYISQLPQFQQPPQAIQNVAPLGFNIFPVSNIEEANATKADLNYNPTFFYNQSKGEVYLKQLDRTTNAATLRIFAEITPQTAQTEVNNPNSVNSSEQKLNTILEGINGLYRLLSPPVENTNAEITNIDVSNIKPARSNKNAK